MTQTPEQPAASPAKPSTELTMRQSIIAAAIGLAVIGGCFAWSYLDFSDDAPDGYDAQVACKDFVRDRLKSPSAADFSGLSHSGSGNTWTVTGTVDAPNSFNAPVRSTFTCKVRIDGDTWHLLSLTGLN